MVRLSFIVPVYGVEKYIKECIRSLYDQDIPQEEYEVICVDDASPDKSIEIIEQYRKKMCDVSMSNVCNLKIIRHTENKRQGGARNTGLREAKGKYVWFVDGDDYIKPNCLKVLLEQVERENLDILDFDYDADFTQQVFTKNSELYDLGPCSGVEYVFNTHKGRWSWRCSSVCGDIIRRELIQDLSFREKVQYEDNDYALLLFAKAKRVHHIAEKPYYYRVVEQSTVNVKPTINQLEYDLALIKEYLRLLGQNQWNDDRWQKGTKELLNYAASELYDKLMNSSQEEKKLFYVQLLKCIPSTWRWMNKKLWLKLIFCNYRCS